MKKYFMILVAALLVACVSSCSKSDSDDDSDSGSYYQLDKFKSLIVGSWEMTIWDDLISGGSHEVEGTKPIWTFYSDGTLVKKDGSNTYNLEYTLTKEDGMIYIETKYKDETYSLGKVAVFSLDDTDLNIQNIGAFKRMK